VICDEIAHMIRRVLDGITVNDDTLAVDLIRQVGPGGGFLSQDHTVRYFRKEMFFPNLFKRQAIEEWVKAGGKMIHEVAHDRVLDILSKAGPINLSAAADAELERAFNQARRWSAEQCSSLR
jgi:trimethylamine---corrinoid protein Co-methyltransferase